MSRTIRKNISRGRFQAGQPIQDKDAYNERVGIRRGGDRIIRGWDDEYYGNPSRLRRLADRQAIQDGLSETENNVLDDY